MEYPELCTTLTRIGETEAIDAGTSEGAKKGWLSRKNGSSGTVSDDVARHEALAKANWEEQHLPKSDTPVRTNLIAQAKTESLMGHKPLSITAGGVNTGAEGEKEAQEEISRQRTEAYRRYLYPDSAPSSASLPKTGGTYVVSDPNGKPLREVHTTGNRRRPLGYYGPQTRIRTNYPKPNLPA